MSAYAFPEYYEVAFSFLDVRREVVFFQRLIAAHSRVPVKRVLELASGLAPHAAEWDRRGYEYTGVDLSAAMRRAAARRAADAGIRAAFVRGDLRRLTLGARRFEFAYVQLGSLYVRSNDEFLEHLRALRRVLAPGGLYLLDGVVQFQQTSEMHQAWTMRRRGITVRTTYDPLMIDSFGQLIDEHLTLRVDDHGRRRTAASRLRRKLIYPQELLLLLGCQQDFEFIGWYNNFTFRQPRREKGRWQVVLRRRSHRS